MCPYCDQIRDFNNRFGLHQCVQGTCAALVVLPFLPPSFIMRLWSLWEIFLVLWLCTVPCVAIKGQTVAMRRAHQLRKADRTPSKCLLTPRLMGFYDLLQV